MIVDTDGNEIGADHDLFLCIDLGWRNQADGESGAVVAENNDPLAIIEPKLILLERRSNKEPVDVVYGC